MTRTFFLLAMLLSAPAPACADDDDDDVKDIPSQDLKAGKDEKKRYFLVGPAKEAKEPKGGWGSLSSCRVGTARPTSTRS